MSTEQFPPVAGGERQSSPPAAGQPVGPPTEQFPAAAPATEQLPVTGPGAGPPVAPPAESKGWQLMLIPVAVGSLVALTLGVYGGIHEGTGVAVNIAGFANHPAPTSAAKVTLTTGAAIFAVLQLLSSLVMYGKIPQIRTPAWIIGAAHRWSGRIAFVLAVPVAVHCLYAAGFRAFDTRILVHSLLGCLFFGAFAVKMLGLRKDGMPGWFLPAVGGVVFTALIGLWWTTAIRFFSTFGSPF